MGRGGELVKEDKWLPLFLREGADPVHFRPALMLSSSLPTAGRVEPARHGLSGWPQGGHNAATGALPSGSAT